MKFGKTLLKLRLPEWSHLYVNYKVLKKIIKEINKVQDDLERQENSVNGGDEAPLWKKESNGMISNRKTFTENEKVQQLLVSFFFNLDRNIEKVDRFYNSQFAEYEKRLEKLLSSTQFHEVSYLIDSNEREKTPIPIDSRLVPPRFATPHHLDDINEVYNILSELKLQFKNLKLYSELNKRAFVKILKKLDKVVGLNQQDIFLQNRIYPLPFAQEGPISKDISVINDIWNKLSNKVTTLDANSISVDELLQSADNNSVPKIKVDTEFAHLKISSINDVTPFIEKDDGKAVIEVLISLYGTITAVPTRSLISILNKSTILKAYNCVDRILDVIPSFSDVTDINNRNFFHHFIILLSKKITVIDQINEKPFILKTQPSFAKPTKRSPPITDLQSIYESCMDKRPTQEEMDKFNIDKEYLHPFKHIIEKLPDRLKQCIYQVDNYGRTPLHYAAKYGFTSIALYIIDMLKAWQYWKDDISLDDIQYWGDTEGLSPIHLAILGKNTETLKTLLNSMNNNLLLTSPTLLFLAIESNNFALINILLASSRFDMNYQDEQTKETALYQAASTNKFEAVACLLLNGADTEIREKLFGWTPIFISAAEGFIDIVQLLLDNGANHNILDDGGWTPMEHAVLRGHLDVADLITITDRPEISHPIYKNPNLDTKSSTKADDGNSHTPSDHSDKNLVPNLNDAKLRKIKSFGHSFLKEEEALMLITLGGTDTRITTPPISLDLKKLLNSTDLDTALSLVITCVDDIRSVPIVLDLPLDDTLAAVNFKIPFKDNNVHTVYFDIVYTYGTYVPESNEVSLIRPIAERNMSVDSAVWSISSGKENDSHSPDGALGNSNDRLIARAVALLNKTNSAAGFNRRLLNDNVTIPIQAKETMDLVGTITFEYTIVTPFIHPKIGVYATDTYWKSLVATRVIGHRGLGKNFQSSKSLQLGENTVESFIAAASLGASYVEFDVQLTKDNIPVVYHDFSVAETGVDIPMHELTLEQFLGLNSFGSKKDEIRGRRNSLDDSEFKNLRRNWDLDDTKSKGVPFYESRTKLMEDRMKLTKAYQTKNYKGNSRGHAIASSFVTLKELFNKIPQNVGFNIECKYPMLDEAEAEDLGQIALEMNHWVDTVLQVVYDNFNGRDIIFSSFHPDICVMLSLKQPNFPILFLTESGTTPMADYRAISLQNAIKFAKSWNLLGIVSAAEPIVKAPRLAKIVKTNGLVCVTYGVENNDPNNAAIEIDAGVDAVIVDNVLAIRRGLTKVQ
ncbi:Glycerophosphocholine phosphodiesterase GDE1 [Nakaseomyces bracarensis]|uniref:Glycerophosphocholine phosphodiesterase GDE1 n=1 Tax=Nakaseomyces bracarensis TaxID=273131 RepID=A0ABR4NU63_9SACH